MIKKEKVPLVTTKMDIAVAFKEIPVNELTAGWFLKNYYNLFFDENKLTLNIFSDFSITTRECLFSCPFVICKRISSKDITTDMIDKFLDNSNLLISINTEKMGLTNGVSYIHDVYLTASYNDCYDVIDFWSPNFQWGHRYIKKELLCYAIARGSINYDAFVIKEKSAFITKDKAPLTIVLKECIKEYLISLNTSDYIGINSIEGLKKYVIKIDSVDTLDDKIFSALCDHYKIWKLAIERLNNKERYMILIDAVLRSAYCLRNYVLKIWRMKTIHLDWRNEILGALTKIKEQELSFLSELINII